MFLKKWGVILFCFCTFQQLKGQELASVVTLQTNKVDNQVDPSQLYQKYYDVPSNMKFSLLVHLLRLEKKGVVMVFCNTRGNVDKLNKLLNQKMLQAIQQN